ncbi:MAG: diguanylate cyclase [Actinomycetota bacterium]|nr:diguanylate cyclase [Actinomycetota bacterium]
MKYSKFEGLVLIFGIGAVLGTIAASLAGRADVVEIIAQFLLIPVIVGATHYGRIGGTVTALVATMVYIPMRLLIITGAEPHFLTQLVGLRALVYLLLGISGGEICFRIKYFLTGLEDRSYIDDVTLLYNPPYLAKLFKNYAQQFERYKNPFSVLIIEMDDRVLQALRKNHYKKRMREIGAIIRSDVRLVDEVGRLGEDEFGLILPNTETPGASIAGKRLEKEVHRYLQKYGDFPIDAVKITVLGYPEDKEDLEKLMG